MMIGARLAMHGGGGKPYDAEVEYLLSKNDAFIDTGIIPTNIDVINSKHKQSATHGNYEGPYSSVFGEWDSNPNYFLLCKVIGGAIQIWAFTPYQQFYLGYQTDWAIFSLTLDLASKRFTVNGESFNLTAVGSPNTQQPSIRIMSPSNNYREITMYAFSVFRSGVPILDLIPVRKGNVGYMYDKVSGKLFGNSGTGAFVLGADI